MKRFILAVLVLFFTYGLHVYATSDSVAVTAAVADTSGGESVLSADDGDVKNETGNEMSAGAEAIDEALDSVEGIVDSVIEKFDTGDESVLGGLLDKLSDNFIVRFFKSIIDAIIDLLNSIFDAASGATVVDEKAI